MRKNGFTLIELLCVIGIVALLMAIAVPSIMAAKNRARNIQCSSNLRQLSFGFVIYQQDNKTFPYGFCDALLGVEVPPEGYAGNPTYDKQGLWWFNYLQKVIEFELLTDSIIYCPAVKRLPSENGRNVLCGNYGVNRSVCKDAQGIMSCPFSGDPLQSGQVRTPSSTFLISDSGYSLLSWLAAGQTTEPVFENPNRIDLFYIPGLTLNQDRSELEGNSDAINGRHPNQMLNISFVDGHNQAYSAESLGIPETSLDEDQLPALWIP